MRYNRGMSLAIPTALFVFIAIVFFGRLIGGLSSERRFVRKHGISTDTPICAQCRYTAVGWTSPICPECGANATYDGLRVGIRRKAVYLDAILMAAFLGIVMPIVIAVVNHVFDAQKTQGNIDFAFVELPRLGLSFTYAQTKADVLPLDAYDADVVIVNLDDGSMSPLFAIDEVDSDAFRSAMDTMLRAPSIAELTDVDAERVDRLVGHVQQLADAGEVTFSDDPWALGLMLEVRGGGYSIQPNAWQMVGMFGTIVGVLPIGIIILNRIVKRVTDGYEYPPPDSPRWSGSPAGSA